MIIKIMLIALTSVILINTLKQIKSEYALPLTIAAAVAMLSIIINEIKTFIDSIKHITTEFPIDNELINIVIKICFIGYVKNFIYNICIDYGYKSIADKVDLAARITLISLCLPWIYELLVNINKLL